MYLCLRIALTVCERRDPVEDCSPEIHPSNELMIIKAFATGPILHKDVVNGLVEYRDGTSDTRDEERLSAKYRGNKGCHKLKRVVV